MQIVVLIQTTINKRISSTLTILKSTSLRQQTANRFDSFIKSINQTRVSQTVIEHSICLRTGYNRGSENIIEWNAGRAWIQYANSMFAKCTVPIPFHSSNGQTYDTRCLSRVMRCDLCAALTRIWDHFNTLVYFNWKYFVLQKTSYANELTAK